MHIRGWGGEWSSGYNTEVASRMETDKASDSKRKCVWVGLKNISPEETKWEGPRGATMKVGV